MVQLTNKTQSSVLERSRGMEINAHQASNDSYYRKHKEDKRREREILTPRLEILQRN